MLSTFLPMDERHKKARRFQERWREIFKEDERTVADAARSMGLGESTVQRARSGHGEPTVGNLYLMLLDLGFDLGEVLK